MKLDHALIAFDALSQETRLQAFRLLVEHGTAGAPAGALSEALGIPHNTLSFHLNHMANAGLVTSRKEGRSVIYSADFSFVQDLIRFMVEDCCSVDFACLRKDGKSGCDIIELAKCCPPKTTSSQRRKA